MDEKNCISCNTPLDDNAVFWGWNTCLPCYADIQDNCEACGGVFHSVNDTICQPCKAS